MIEPVIATALILFILALIAYYLQPQQPQHQRHYYHQIRRARVMADPQRHLDLGAERRNEWQVYERENEEGEGEDEGRGEVAIRVRELGLIERGVVRGELGLEDGADVGDEKRLGTMMTGECHGSGVEVGNAAAVSVEKLDMQTETASRGSALPSIHLTTADSDTPSTILTAHQMEREATFETRHDTTLEQQRRQRVRFDEALRMHSFGGSQYVGRVVDRDV